MSSASFVNRIFMYTCMLLRKLNIFNTMIYMKFENMGHVTICTRYSLCNNLRK